MSDEALRRAAERVLTGSAICAGSKQFHDDVRLLARATLSEGQAPEPVAQEPDRLYDICTVNGLAAMNRDMYMYAYRCPCAPCSVTRQRNANRPAGMDAARAKAIDDKDHD